MAAPPKQIYNEGQVRSLSEWDSLRRLRAARKLADAGVLREAADLTEQVIFSDDRVQATMGVRVTGKLRLPVDFESHDGAESDETPEVEALRSDFYAACPESDLSALEWWAHTLGVGLAELVWTERSGRVIPRLKIWNPRWLRFDWQAREWRLTVDGGSEIPIVPGDGKWWMYTPGGSNRPWSRAPWIALGIACISKRFASVDQLRHSEKHGGAIVAGTAPEGSSVEDRKAFLDDLSALTKDSASVLPPGYDIRMIEASAQAWQQYPALIEQSNKAISTCIAGQNLTSEVTGGSFAAAQVHAQIASHIIQSDAETLSTSMREQVLGWWAEFNFGDASRAPWVRWDVTPPADKRDQAETLVGVGNAVTALQNAGLSVDVEELARRYDIPLTDDPADALFQGLTANRSKRRGWRNAITLDSGRPGPKSFGDGLDYSDAVGDSAVDAALTVIENDLADIRRIIDESDTPEALRDALSQHFELMDPAALNELIRRSLLLAELAGRYAMTDEVISAD